VTIVSTESDLRGVAVTAGDGAIFWSSGDDGRILALEQDGAAPREIDTPPPPRGATGSARRAVVAADARWVYWTRDEWIPTGGSSTSSRLERTLARTPRSGGAAETLPNLSESASTPGPFLATGSALFAYDGGEYGGSVRRLDLGTKATTSVHELPSSFSWSWRDLRSTRGGVVGTTMYGAFVLDDAARAARTVPLVESGGGQQPHLVTSDGTTIFAVVIASSDNYRFVRAPLDGVGPREETVLDDRNAHPHGLAVDDAWVYLLQRVWTPGETRNRDRVTAFPKAKAEAEGGGASRVLHEGWSGTTSRPGNRLLHDGGSLFVVDDKAVRRIVTPPAPRR